MSIAAVVIWYNPKPAFAENTRTYANHVTKTIIVDNSDTINEALTEGLPNVEYIPLCENRGIAAALNIGVRRAAELGMDWALTMDQDSWFEEDDLSRFLDPKAPHFQFENTAIFCPNTIARKKNGKIVDCVRTITSGSLTNIVHFTSAGGFNEDMFIDEVDHEYCYRMKRSGVKILQLESVFMHHTLGKPVNKVILGRRFSSSNHSPDRKYYIARNLLYVGKHFPEYSPNASRAIVNHLLTILLVDDQKILKIFRVARGVLDYWTGRMGKLRQFWR